MQALVSEIHFTQPQPFILVLNESERGNRGLYDVAAETSIRDLKGLPRLDKHRYGYMRSDDCSLG